MEYTNIHCSHANYWEKGDILIAVEVHVDDIITVQEGKAIGYSKN